MGISHYYCSTKSTHLMRWWCIEYIFRWGIGNNLASRIIAAERNRSESAETTKSIMPTRTKTITVL